MNGLALHGGFIPYGGTFLTFSDYARNALRMAALMKMRSIFVFTHDSIGLGEDGPTHQSVEHAASLRLMPNLDVWRPCDTVESAVAWSPRSSARTARARCCFRARTCLSSSATRRRSPRYAAAATCCPTPPSAKGGHHRHRLGSPACDGRSGEACRAGRRRCAWCRCPRPAYSTARTPRGAKPSCRRACRASRSRRASPTSGASTSASKARWSASTASANRPRPEAVQVFRLHRRSAWWRR